MATITKQQKSNAKTPGFLIQFRIGRDRKSMFFGGKRFSEKQVIKILEMVKHFERIANNPDEFLPQHVKTWLENITDEIRDKFVKVGFVKKIERHTVDDLPKQFLLAKSQEIKPIASETKRAYSFGMSRFFSFFDRSTDVKELEKTDIEKWITYLCNDYTDPRSRQRISEATVKGTVIKVKAVFEWAKKTGYWRILLMGLNTMRLSSIPLTNG